MDYVNVACVNANTQTYLSDILLLLLTQGQLDEDLLQLLIAVVDDELFETVVLWGVATGVRGWGIESHCQHVD